MEQYVQPALFGNGHVVTVEPQQQEPNADTTPNIPAVIPGQLAFEEEAA